MNEKEKKNKNRLQALSFYMIPAATVTISVLFFFDKLGITSALFYLSLLLVFIVPGIPIMRFAGLQIKPGNMPVLFLMGYSAAVLLTVAGWAAFKLDVKCAYPIIIAASAAGLVISSRRRKRKPLIEMPDLTRRDAAVILLFCLITTAMLYMPWRNIGASIAGTKAFRAYFSGDYLKHVGVAAILSRGKLPPPNHYYLGTTLHYYWFFYVFPALLHRTAGAAAPLLSQMIFMSMIVNFAFIGLFAVFLRRSVKSSFIMGAGLSMATLFYSYEGSYLLIRAVRLGQTLRRVTAEHNVDAVTRWYFGHPQIDGLFRGMMYTPQHLFGLSLILLCLLVLGSGRKLKDWPVALTASIILVVLFGFNSFLGITAIAWLGLLWAVRLIMDAGRRKALFSRGIGALAVIGIAGLIYYALQMINTGGGFVIIGPIQTDIVNIIAILFLNFGPILPLAVIGIARSVKSHKPIDLPVEILTALALGMMLFTRIRSFESDVALKVGLIANVGLIYLACRGLEFIAFRKKIAALILFLVLALPALPTPLMDVWNAQDITNPAFTTTFTDPELNACEWLKKHTPRDVVVQSEPTIRTYSFLPTMAERPTAVADYMHARIFMIPDQDYYARLAQVETIFQTPDPRTAVAKAQELRISLIFSEPAARALFPDGVEKFDRLQRIYDQDAVRLYLPVLAEKPFQPEPHDMIISEVDETILIDETYSKPRKIPSGRPLSLLLYVNEKMLEKNEKFEVILTDDDKDTLSLRSFYADRITRENLKKFVRLDLWIPKAAETRKMNLIILNLNEDESEFKMETPITKEIIVKAYEEVPKLPEKRKIKPLEGWYALEKTGDGEFWRWMKGEAEVSFLNPFRDARLYVEFDLPYGAPPTTLAISTGNSTYSMPLKPGRTRAAHLRIPERLMGFNERFIVAFQTDKTFIPRETGISPDDRTLGARLRRLWFE